MKLSVFLLAVPVATLAAWAARAQPAPSLDCSLPFTRTADEAEFVKAFGRPNVAAAELDDAQGGKERATVLFPNDPARRLEVFWRDANNRRNPARIVIRDKSRWTIKTPDRKTVGLNMAIDQVEQANGRPFSVSGGGATGWRGGVFEAFPGGCTVSIRFGNDHGAPASAVKKTSGDQTFASSDATLRAARPHVSTISVGWSQ